MSKIDVEIRFDYDKSYHGSTVINAYSGKEKVGYILMCVYPTPYGTDSYFHAHLYHFSTSMGSAEWKFKTLEEAKKWIVDTESRVDPCFRTSGL